MEPFPPDSPPDLLPPGWHGGAAPPLEIDVGCHKGLFLVEMARLHPGHNFLGVELQSERVERTRKKIRTLALPNAAVVRAEGQEVVRALPAFCADGIHVLFPDPWPKRRHHVRRLVQAGFLRDCARVLKPGGLLRLVTDDAAYAANMEEVAAGCPLLPRGVDERTYPLTEFQKKFLTDARPVYTLVLRRVDFSNSA